VVNKVTTRH